MLIPDFEPEHCEHQHDEEDPSEGTHHDSHQGPGPALLLLVLDLEDGVISGVRVGLVAVGEKHVVVEFGLWMNN